MHDGEHDDNVSTLDPTTVCGKQVEEILQVNAGIKGVWVSEVPDPVSSTTLRMKYWHPISQAWMSYWVAI